MVVAAIDPVVAAAAAQGVVSGKAPDPVVALVAGGLVVAVAGIDDIVPDATGQGIATGSAGQGVVAVTARQGVVAVFAEEDVVMFIAEQPVGAIAAMQDVIAHPPSQRIAAGVAIESVVVLLAFEDIVPRAAMEDVVSPVSAQEVVACLAMDDVVVKARFDRVVAEAGKNGVVAVGRPDIVVAIARGDELIPPASIDMVVAAKAPDGDRVGGYDVVGVVSVDPSMIGLGDQVFDIRRDGIVRHAGGDEIRPAIVRLDDLLAFDDEIDIVTTAAREDALAGDVGKDVVAGRPCDALRIVPVAAQIELGHELCPELSFDGSPLGLAFEIGQEFGIAAHVVEFFGTVFVQREPEVVGSDGDVAVDPGIGDVLALAWSSLHGGNEAIPP